MSEATRSAPIADWVTIAELHRDPFPIFEQLRAEGGVHWVPAVNRYLVTSYAAVHETELDQTTYSANEEGSLMIRAMGHSMLRRDDPEHYVERKAWQPVLRPGVVKKTWMPVFRRNAERYLAEFVEKGAGADLVWDFAAPYAAENLREVVGLRNSTQQDLQRWSQTLIDATGNYADDPAVWAAGLASYDEVDVALDEMLSWYRTHEDTTMLSSLLRLPDYQMPVDAIRANLKMTIGGGLNEPRDAIGVAAWAMLEHPEQLAKVRENPARWDSVFDEAIRWIAPIGMYSRQVTRANRLSGVDLPAGAKLGICLLSANRDTQQWDHPERFDITRSGEGAHLAFGKGVHVCLGAWVARAEVADVALPMLFERLNGLSIAEGDHAESRGWVFRGMTRLPVSWQSVGSPAAGGGEGTSGSPSIAIVGSGPSGCYTAQALRRRYPSSQIAIIEKLPVPYGLVRYGVAADHQGTKAIDKQFSRLFEKEGVQFVGNTSVGASAEGHDLTLDELRAAFDVVVVATGLSEDVSLAIPGCQLPGVHGAGRITRLLNSHPLEPGSVPRLGTDVAVIGHGNVAMDLVRLLAKRDHHLAGSDIDDAAHGVLTERVTRIHVIGRSLPNAAKFDPVMVREITELDGVHHVVHGVEGAGLEAASDPRSLLIHELVQGSMHSDRSPARVSVDWWFGCTPQSILGNEVVTGVELVDQSGARIEIGVSDVITAVGFHAVPETTLVPRTSESATTGRIDHGLYAAGWVRRGPRGTIPTQRTDARELAEVVGADLAELRSASRGKPGLAGITARIAGATSYSGWLLIDTEERENAADGRVRAKVADLDRLRRLAAATGETPRSVATDASSGVNASAGRQTVRILFGTESGNAELVAEELAAHLEPLWNVETVDLDTAGIEVLDPQLFTVVVCSTYGDGELPTGTRTFHDLILSSSPDLEGMRYAMFGLGDRSYVETYSRGSEILDAALSSLGARRVGEYGRHDAGDERPATDLALAWIAPLLADHAERVG